MSEYASAQYATVDDFLDILGMSKAEQKVIAQNILDRFNIWITEGNNNVEGKVSKLSDDTTLTENSDAFTFAKNAVINWALYKQRSMLGSANKKDALNDYETTITNLENILIKTRGVRTVTTSILGTPPTDKHILLPSQIDTQFY